MPDVRALPRDSWLAGACRGAQRRRAWTGAAALAVAATVALAGCGAGTDGEAVAVTAAPSSAVPTERPSRPGTVYGAKVGWLPDGYVQVSDQFQDLTSQGFPATPGGGGPPPGARFTGQSVYFAGQADVAAVRAVDKPHLDGPEYVITVLRGQVPSADDDRALATSADPDTTFEDITVAGHPALLSHASGTGPPYVWSVRWTGGESADASAAVSGTERDVVLRIAENLTLGPKPAGPADPGTATARIRDTARRAFQGSTGLAMLDFVDDAAGVARLAVDKGLFRDPRTGATINLADAGDVVFLGPDDAGAELRISYPDSPGLNGPVVTYVRFVLVRGGWKVTRGSFCLGMFSVFRGCPVSP